MQADPDQLQEMGLFPTTPVDNREQAYAVAFIVMTYITMAYKGMATRGIAYTVMAYAAMVCMAYIAMAYTAIATIVTACTFMAVVMARGESATGNAYPRVQRER